MLNQEDKQFISQTIAEAIGGLRIELDGRFLTIGQRFEKIDQRFEKIDQRFEKIDQRFEKIETEIRHNGVLIEGLQDVVYSIAEGVDVLNGRMDRMEKDVTEIKDNIFDLPTIRRMVKRHDRELAILRR